MKKLLLVLASVLGLSANVSAHDLADAMDRVLPSIAYIRVERFQQRDRVNETTREVTKVDIPASPIVGSGFIIDSNKVVTNYHVISYAVQNNTKVFITLIDSNARYEGKILGYDKVADVALLEIEGDHPSVIISPSTQLRMGDIVFSISNFYGIGWSGTQGTVSSNSRDDTRYPYIKNLQLQLLTGTGSSGGPVFNDQGEVVALNRSIVSMFPTQSLFARTRSPSMLSMVAFPVRADSVIKSLDRIRDELVVKRVDLGARLLEFGSDSAFHTNEDSDFQTGIIVVLIDKDVVTTLKNSDLIVSVEGKEFISPADLLTWLDKNYSENDSVNVQVYRGEEIINIAVTLRTAGD